MQELRKSGGRFCGFLRKIRPTQLWVELSWVVAKSVHENSVAGEMSTYMYTNRVPVDCCSGYIPHPIRLPPYYGGPIFKINTYKEEVLYKNNVYIMDQNTRHSLALKGKAFDLTF